MGLRWASDGPQMGLRWASDGPRMELGWASESLRWVSDGQQKGSRMFKMKLLWSPTNPLYFSRIGIRFASLMDPSVSRYQWQFRCFQHLQLKIISRIPEALCWGAPLAPTNGASRHMGLELASRRGNNMRIAHVQAALCSDKWSFSLSLSLSLSL